MSEVKRKLVSVRRIADINPIEGADKIVCATVDGWQLVTQKSNNFKVGDLVVYYEIDSFLPITEKFEFLRKSSYRKMGDKEGFRIKTIKLRGQVSQGLILPLGEVLNDYPCFTQGDVNTWVVSDINPCDGTSHYSNIEEGFDLTDFLEVIKWEPPLPAELTGIAKGNFPSFLQKTDQERIQNIYNSLYDSYETTLKLDGSSITVYYKDGQIGVCSRNLDLEDNDNTFWKTAKSTGLVNALTSFGKNIAVQGELMGPGIQGNREGLKEHQIFVFDIYDIDSGCLMVPYVRNQIFNNLKELGTTVEHAPVLDDNIRLDMFASVDDFLDYANRESLNNSVAEGVVFKPHRRGKPSFKVINNVFLLGED